MLYQQVASELRKAIYSGVLGPGAQLPTEAQLMEDHGVSRNTVRLALGELVNEGLVTRTPRRGTIVRDRRPLLIYPQRELEPQPSGELREAFAFAVTQEGREPSQLIEVLTVTPVEEIASRLELADGELAVVRRRLRFVDGQPYNTNDSYFPRDLVANSEIARPGDIARGANRVLEELGHEQVRVIDDIWARMPNQEEAERLQLELGTPVVVYVRVGYDRADMPVRVAVSVLPADKHLIRYELDRR
ncbi:GntR family transcriptional regulator [Nonomuraea roseoviolacea subsp. roseoviolacea]|uniref:GntR family transcriptional regulator n=1 Tax=Nonomuraea roseoviolacea subsp. carminata TaxID=160689 RepID=A0ABT1JTB7_9ACTN|nr:GntR family transcriptional regulator [Nonomuraea roseoviolacea]MCP2344996.1 GntR family transcriptional regulator [Nonomuraea roseoviolacea subsp. carminata]